MRKADAMPSRYFRAKDLPEGWTLQAEIELARLEKFEGERGKESTEKMVVFFRRQKSALVVGSVTWDLLVKATGEEDSDSWKGHVVTLFKTTCQFGRETVDCIRVKEADKKAAPKKAAPKAAPKTVPPEEDDAVTYDSDEAVED
jgi:hypothetical protein